MTFRGLFWLLLFASVIYGAYKFVPPYFGYFMLKTDVEEEAKVAHMYTNEKLRSRILMKANSWNVPIGNEHLMIERGREDIAITVDYTVTLDFFDRYQKELQFHIHTEKSLKETSGVLR